MSSVPTSLVRYRPDLEQPAPDEAETIQALCDSLRKIAQTTWELRAQLCTDLTKMPIEDASVEWAEELSPYLTIATIQAWPQATWSPSRAKALDDGLFFSPWHGLAAHQPMGGVMRSRKPAYEMSAKFRGDRNGCPMHEPTTSPVQEGAAQNSSV